MGRADACRSFKRRTIGDVVTNGGTFFSLESGVPVVFDGVIGAAVVEKASYGGPLVAEPGVSPDDGLVLVRREGAVGHLRRELVAPP